MRPHAFKVVSIHWRELDGCATEPPCAIAGGYILYRPAVVEAIISGVHTEVMTVKGREITPTAAETFLSDLDKQA